MKQRDINLSMGPSIYYVRTEGEGGVCQNRYFAYGCIWWGGEGVQTDEYVRIAIDACILNCWWYNYIALLGRLSGGYAKRNTKPTIYIYYT